MMHTSRPSESSLLALRDARVEQALEAVAVRREALAITSHAVANEHAQPIAQCIRTAEEVAVADAARCVLSAARRKPEGRGMNKAFAGVLGCVGIVAVIGCSSAERPSDECVGSGSDALRTCAKGTTLRGVDVSFYQGNVAWKKVRAAGRRFAFARVSDGVKHPDSKFAQNWRGMRKAGLVRGAYQFFRPSQDAHAQAALMLSKIHAAGGLKAGDLPPVIDVEVTDGHSAGFVVARVRAWLEEVTAKTRRKPVVYTAAFMSSVIGKHFAKYPLWVANFGVTCPTMPSGWTTWKFFQNSSTGHVSGIAGNVDTDRFNGGLGVLQDFTIQKKTSIEGEAVTIDDGLSDAVDDDAPEVLEESGAIPDDGSEGATLGRGVPVELETSPLSDDDFETTPQEPPAAVTCD